VRLKLPGITDKDKEDVLFAIENDFDFIAMSFVRNKENILELRDFLSEHNASHIKIISKIENQEAIENLEEIVKYSDGVMVAR
jgi:pyruvate kinase